MYNRSQTFSETITEEFLKLLTPNQYKFVTGLALNILFPLLPPQDGEVKLKSYQYFTDNFGKIPLEDLFITCSNLLEQDVDGFAKKWGYYN